MSSSRSESAASRARPSVRWLERRLTRRAALKYGAVGTGVVVSSLYVKPGLRSIGVTPAYAQATPVGGCTPGLWKNRTQIWPCGVSPLSSAPCADDIYDTVFGVSLFGSKTLLEVLNLGGAPKEAFGRHSVAALLNAAHPDIPYPQTPAQVVADVQAAVTAYAGGANPGALETAKNDFESQNEASCFDDLGISLGG